MAKKEITLSHEQQSVVDQIADLVVTLNGFGMATPEIHDAVDATLEKREEEQREKDSKNQANAQQD